MKKVSFAVMASVVLATCVSFTADGKKQPHAVYSFKNLGEFNNSEGNEFTKLLVTCNSDKQPRYIQRIVGQELWCIEGQPASCAKERMEPAIIACTTKAKVFAASIKSQQVDVNLKTREQTIQQNTLKKKLIAEQMEVEQKRLDIETRRIQLREQELKLLASKKNS